MVSGQVIAEGTETDSITFERYEDTQSNLRWGNIIFTSTAPKSSIKYCKFLYAHTTYREGIENYYGALCAKNGKLDVSYCRFLNCDVGIGTTTLTEPMLIYHNLFQQYERTYEGSYLMAIWSDAVNTDNEMIVAYNTYIGRGQAYEFYNSQYYPVTRLFENMTLSEPQSREEVERDIMAGDCYGNQIINSTSGGTCANSISMNSKGYVKRNMIINSGGLSARGYMDVCDNVMLNSNNLEAGYTLPEMDSVTDVYNNRLEHTRLVQTGGGRIFNNVIIDSPGPSPMELGHHTTLVANNTVYNTPLHAMSYYNGLGNVIVENNIFGSGDLYINNLWTGAVFRNNLMSFAVPSQAVNGGGNLRGVDPLFVNPVEGDFHLQATSPCIDAGFDSTGYQVMDYEYHHRVADGNGDNWRRIDMGAYEYNSNYQGGYNGHVLFPDNTPVSLVKVDIEGVTREYTDSFGYFRFSAPAGTYTLYAHHIYLGDREYQVTINEQQTTVQDFVWVPEGSDDNTTPHSDKPQTVVISKLHVFPNPCNNIANIGYTLSKGSLVETEVFNVKGQRVKSLYAHYQPKGYNSLIWDGRDERGNKVGDGVYYLKLKAKGEAAVQKLLFMR